MIVYVNGEYVPDERASVSVYDHGLLYGDGVFETVVARRGTVHRLDAHLDRLMRSLAAVALDPPHDRAGFADIIAESLRRNGLRDAYGKLVVTRGSNGTPLLDPAGCVPGVICLVRPHSDDEPGRLDQARRGLRVKTAAIRRPPAQVLDPHIKSLNHLSLRGLTVHEGTVELYDMYTADEAFLCSTAIGLLPVVNLDGRAIGTGTPGPVVTALREAYLAELNR